VARQVVRRNPSEEQLLVVAHRKLQEALSLAARHTLVLAAVFRVDRTFSKAKNGEN